ncbi:T9SS type A sorting domain-containing protein [Carboxylicivirga marina]|uniref:T9SS type A sorting domain-containing protein n=1 Tax=Carboxylicivirga marina TaxID=2800988 RepID=UPI0025982561|nr:T9SS type A sorting domain-containing protein [uncultured Carboxylicivirga sp.]
MKKLLKNKMLWLHLLLMTVSISGYTQVQLHLNTDFMRSEQLTMGYNGRSTEGPSWTDEAFLSLVSESQAGVIRYPAGTQANYWDWRTGTFIEGTKSGGKTPFTIPLVVNGIDEGVKLIYVVNMARPTPITGVSYEADEATLISENTLLLKVDDMLAALQAFQQAGQLPEVVELGNEFYFDNEHAAIYAANPELYLQHSKVICQHIRQVYPDMKILMITTKGGSSSRDNWNNTIFNGLKNDSELAGMIHGVVQHHYLSTYYGDQTAVTNVQTAKIAIAEGIQYPLEKSDDYAMVPDDFELWLTEYGATKDNTPGSWASGLRAAAYTMQWLKLGEKITNLMYHHVTNHPDVINKDQMEAGPVAIALAYLYQAADECLYRRSVDISNNPEAIAGVGAIQGLQFINQNSEQLVLLNIHEHAVTNVDIRHLLSDETAEINQLTCSNVYDSPVFEGSGISKNTFTANQQIDLPPFSLTVIKVNKVFTSVDELKNDESLTSTYFDKTLGHLEVKINKPFSNASIQLWDLNGKLCFENKVTSTKQRYLLDTPPGIYVCQMNVDSDIQSSKLLID